MEAILNGQSSAFAPDPVGEVSLAVNVTVQTPAHLMGELTAQAKTSRRNRVTHKPVQFTVVTANGLSSEPVLPLVVLERNQE